MIGKVVGFLTVITCLQNISYSQVGPFYPFEAHSRGVSAILLGYIIGAFSIMYIISAVICGKYLSKIGKAAGLKFGMLFIVVQLFGLGFLKYVESRDWFIALSILAQCFGGVGAGMNTTCAIAIITNHYPKERELNLGILEGGTGFGLLLGPLIGGLLYAIGGYLAPFLTVGSICLLLFPLL